MRVLLAMLLDESGAAIVEYAIIAFAVALPLLGIGYAIAQNAGSNMNTVTGGLQNWGVNPP